MLTLDMRPDQWEHPQAYGINVRTLLPSADVIIGTEEEFYAALASKPIMTVLNTDTKSELSGLIDIYHTKNPQQVLVLKRGGDGVRIYNESNQINLLGFAVEVVNTVGAGDAFASGLIYGRNQGWDWHRAGQFANACGALVVTRHGCAKAMPFREEVETFLQSRGITQ